MRGKLGGVLRATKGDARFEECLFFLYNICTFGDDGVFVLRRLWKWNRSMLIRCQNSKDPLWSSGYRE